MIGNNGIPNFFSLQENLRWFRKSEVWEISDGGGDCIVWLNEANLRVTTFGLIKGRYQKSTASSSDALHFRCTNKASAKREGPRAHFPKQQRGVWVRGREIKGFEKIIRIPLYVFIIICLCFKNYVACCKNLLREVSFIWHMLIFMQIKLIFIRNFCTKNCFDTEKKR